jgi:phage head maturation protease
MGSSTPDIERRYLGQWIKKPQLERRGDTVVGGPIALFGKRSQPVGGFVEVISEAFFNKSIADRWPAGTVCRFNDDQLLGTTAGATLAFSRTAEGLEFDVDIPQHLPLVCEYAQRGDITDVALSWQIFESTWEPSEGGYPVRRLLSGRLASVDVLTKPAQPVNVDVALRSLAEHVGEPIEEVTALSDRDELRQLFGWPPPESPVQREPIRLGRNARKVYTEALAPDHELPKILDQYRVTATPADLSRSNK